MSFSFGQNTSSGGSGLFGSQTAPAPQSTPQPTTSLFGSQPQQQQQSGGLFGSTAQQSQQSGGLFGSTSQPQQQQQQQSGGLFGSTQQQAQPAASGGLFGNTQQAAAPGTSSGLFGSTTQPQQSGSGLFGSTAQKPATGLFGSTAQPGQGSLFGQTGQQSQTQGGLFGQNQAQQPQQTGGGLFGGGSSLFGGQNQNQQTQQPQSGLFGSTSQPQQSTGLFGSTSQQPQGQNSLFSSTTQPQQSLFSSTSQQPNQPGLFASTNQNPLNASYGAKAEIDIETRMMVIKNAWDSASPDCRFKYFFYNMVEPGTTGQYGRPAGANDDAKWAKVMRENPDRQSMVPVLATGWVDVKKRVEMQEKIASVHQERIKEITTALSQLSRTTSLSTSIRLAALQAQLTTLLHRLIHLVAQTPQFIPILQSTAFRQEESAVAKTLEAVKADLDGRNRPKQANGGVVGLRSNGNSTPRRGEARMIGQVNELWGQVEEIRRLRKGVQAGREGWMGDERALAEVAEILSNQQLALQRLSELVNNSLFDADVMLPQK